MISHKRVEYVEVKKYKEIINPVYIKNKYAVFSTYKYDYIFRDNNPIFCAGIVKDFAKNVFNLNKNDIVGYISHEKNNDIVISSNLVVKFHKIDPNNYYIIPYASYVMNILRNINPKLGDKIVLIGLNIYSLLLFELIKLSGATVYLMNYENYTGFYKLNEIQKQNIYKLGSIQSPKRHFNKILLFERLELSLFEEVNNYLKNFNTKTLYLIGENPNLDDNLLTGKKLIFIDEFDKGFSDPSYKLGVKYPHAYIRWDFKRNLEYFVSLIETKKINLDFINIITAKVKFLEDIEEKIINTSENQIMLFEIEN